MGIRIVGSLLLVSTLTASAAAQSPDSVTTTRPAPAAPPCVRSTSGPTDVGPSATRLITPPTDIPRRLRGRSVDVRVLVSVEGRVDSVIMTDVPDSAYAARMRQAFRGYRFRPARRDGCLVSDWFEVTINFPDRQ